MPEREYVQFSMRPRSSSHHHHQYTRPTVHLRCFDDCASVTVNAWNDMMRENRRLKAEAEQAKASRDTAVEDKDKLRRRVAALRAELEGLRDAQKNLQKAKDIADIRVREMTQTVTNQGAEITQLNDEVTRLSRAHKKDQLELSARADEAREAWSMVTDLRRQLRRWREPIFSRRYSFAS